MKRGFYLTLIAFVGIFTFSGFVIAEDAALSDVNELQGEIDAREAQVDAINSKIDEIRDKINYYSNQSASLSADIALIENETALLDLDIQSTEAQAETKQLEIAILEEAIREQEANVAYQREILEEMIFELNKNDGIGFIEVLFGSEDFNELFSVVERLESVNAEMNTTLGETHATKQRLSDNKLDQEENLDELLVLQDEMEMQLIQLEHSAEAKEVLIASTEASESQYRVLMSELRQEQAYISSQLAQLHTDLEGKISSLDELGDATIFTWPVNGIITAIFHDPSYPFRHLFEHGGLDIAVPSGTPIESAAPGYVAWARTGRSYGNYVMVIHADGYATLYAHLSSINVTTDQFVSRGQIIGYSGNTGLSTGPHLHMELRKNGIPVDPLLYLQ